MPVSLDLPIIKGRAMLNIEIRVKGCLDEHWSVWFNEFAIQHTVTGETILKGVVQDQSALYGLIGKLRDLGLSLVEVNSTEESPKT